MDKLSKDIGDAVGFGRIRDILRYHRESSKRQPEFYRVDVSIAYDYFSCNPNYRKQVLEYFSKLRDEGVRIVHLDICGRAGVQSLGGDISYCFSLKDESRTDWDGNVIVQGDLFSNSDFNGFLREVKSQPEAPALITFRPIVGLQDNNPYLGKEDYLSFKEVTEGILAKRFGQCVDVLRRWGYMYLERPFQFDGSLVDFLVGTPQEEYELSQQVKSLAEKHHCNVKIEPSIHGPKFLIRKRSG